MADRVVMHIGAPKSGTTYLQSILFANRPLLRERGVLVPGSGIGDYARAAVATTLAEQNDQKPVRVWRSLLDETHAWDRTALLTSEWFCLTPGRRVGRTVEQLGTDDVHVVYTARALVPLVAAAWQETLKLGASHDLDTFVASLDEGRARWSWWSLDPAAVLERWERYVPADRIHVVTVPARGGDPGELLRRFAAACGFDPAGLDTSTATANESLSVEAAEVMRAVAPRVADLVDFDSLPWPDRYRWLRRYLGHGLLVPVPGHRIALRDSDVAAVEDRSRTGAGQLAARGYRIHGDLDDLTGVGNAPDSLHPGEVPAADLFAAAAPVMAQLVSDVRRQALRADELEGKR